MPEGLEFLTSWMNESVFWLIAIVAFIVVEAGTFGLTSIWFAFAALIALLASLLGLDLTVQIALFVVSATIFLIFTRPFVRKYLKIGAHKTNVDAIIGQHALVTKKIESFAFGQAKVKGQIWTAKSATDDAIEVGCEVEIIAVEGVKIIVREIKEA